MKNREINRLHQKPKEELKEMLKNEKLSQIKDKTPAKPLFDYTELPDVPYNVQLR